MFNTCNDVAFSYSAFRDGVGTCDWAVVTNRMCFEGSGSLNKFTILEIKTDREKYESKGN